MFGRFLAVSTAALLLLASNTARATDTIRLGGTGDAQVSTLGLDDEGDTSLIAYHGGGEPTVNWRVMTESLKYAREKAAALNLEVRAASASTSSASSR